MTRVLVALLAAVALATLAFGSACSKKEEAPVVDEDPGKGPPPMSRVEQQRGHQACIDFKTKVCACAGEKPDDATLARHCKLADSRIQAINISVDLSDTGNGSPRDRALAIGNARQTAHKCIERIAELANGCALSGP